MKQKAPARTTAFSLPEMLKEVRQTVQVFLTPEGIELMRGTPYVREDGYIACREIYDASDPTYLHLDVRYSKDDPLTPKHTYVAIPHSYVRYLTADGPLNIPKKSPRKT